MVCDPITIVMSAPTGDGGAAAVVCSEEFVRKQGLEVSAESNNSAVSLFKRPERLFE